MHELSLAGAVIDTAERHAGGRRVTHVRVRPTWLRYSDYSGAEPLILEYTAAELAALY